MTTPTNPRNFPLPQTHYNQFPTVAFNGQVADGGPFRDIISRLLDADCGVGIGLCTGVDNTRVKLISTGTDVTTAAFKGFVIYEPNREPAYPTPSAGTMRKAGDSVQLLRKGRIWVMPQGDVVDDGPVYLCTTANYGQVRGDNTNASLLPNAYVVIGATVASGNPCQIQLG